MRKKGRMTGTVTRLILLILAVYAVCSIVSLQMQVRAKRVEYLALKADYDSAVQRAARLQDLVDAPISESELARIAREKLGMILPGERVFITVR